MHPLLAGPPRVVNIGLAGFGRDLAANGVAVVHVDWRPPSKFHNLLSALDQRAGQIEHANAEALRRIFAADPVLVGVRRAGELIAELDAERLILHAGPPIAWERMCGPLRGAVCGAIVFEGALTRDGSTFKLAKLEPSAFGGAKGLRFEYAVVRKIDNLQLSGVGFASVSDGELFAMLYSAPRLGFFARHQQRVEDIAKTAKVRAKPSGG